MRKCRRNRGTVAVTFAAGLLISSFCPPQCLVAILAVWVIVLALSGRYR